MDHTIKSGSAMLKVIESWGVGRIYGSSEGYLSSLMELLEKERGLRYLETRGEEEAALAAMTEARLSERPAVCLAAPGGAHRLLSGLYAARSVRAPLAALIVEPAGEALDGAAFAAFYAQRAAKPEELPHMMDEALRRAMRDRGPALVTAPDDLLGIEIADGEYSGAANYRQGAPALDEPDLEAAVRLIEASRRPLLFAGQGAREAGLEVVSLADYFSLPIVVSGRAKGIVADDEENHLGTAALLGTKPANEALTACDLAIVAGCDFPYSRPFLSPSAKCVQIDLDPASLGRRRVEAPILGDAGEAMRRLIKIGRRKRRTKFLDASRLNMKNWRSWIRNFERPNGLSLRVEAVFGEINRAAAREAVFAVEPGEILIHAARLLKLNGRDQTFLCPGSLAGRASAIPAGIAAKALHPERQVFTISDEAAAARSLGDVAAQVKYGAAVVNLVFSDGGRGLMDFAKAAEAMGAEAFTVTDHEGLKKALGEAVKAESPTLVNIKIAKAAPFPAHEMILDESRYGREAVEAFRGRYALGDMPTLEQIMRGLPEE